MEQNRIMQIVLDDLKLDLLKQSESLEQTINSSMETEEKLSKIKLILNQITTTEAMLSKFTSILALISKNETQQ